MIKILSILKKWALLLILLMLGTIFYFLDLHHYLNMASIKVYYHPIAQWSEIHYVNAIFIYLVLFIFLVACGIPCATILTLVGGFLFGWLGFIYAEIGTTVGGFLLFLAAKISLGKSLKYKILTQEMEQGLKTNAFNYLLMLRLIPIFPCTVCNIGAGTFNIPKKTYLLATILGIAPSTLIYIMMGRGLENLLISEDAFSFTALFAKPTYLYPIIGLIILSIIPIFYKQIKK